MIRPCDFCHLSRPSLFTFRIGKRLVHACAKHKPASMAMTKAEATAVRVHWVRVAAGMVT